MRKYAFHKLGMEGPPRNGYAIIGEILFRVEKGRIKDSWELSEGLNSTNVQEVVAEARKVAEMPRGSRIYVDNEAAYDPELCEERGRLLSIVDYYTEERSEQERGDPVTFAEYCIYVNSEGKYDSELCEDCGRLLTPAEYYHEECSEQEREDLESFAEYCSEHF